MMMPSLVVLLAMMMIVVEALGHMQVSGSVGARSFISAK